MTRKQFITINFAEACVISIRFDEMKYIQQVIFFFYNIKGSIRCNFEGFYFVHGPVPGTKSVEGKKEKNFRNQYHRNRLRTGL